MITTVLCNTCYHSIDVTTYIEDYHETDPEEMLAVVKCTNCWEHNTIYWTQSVDFYARDADEEEVLEHNDIWGEDLKITE